MKLLALDSKFDLYDYNGDGRLSKQEIAQGIRESEVSGVSEEELDLLMKYYDVNDDGYISRWEAKRATTAPLPEELHPSTDS